MTEEQPEIRASISTLTLRPAYQDEADSICPSCTAGRKRDGKECEICKGRGYVKYRD